MKTKYNTHSRSKTPWDNINELSALEIFIKSKYKDNYHQKHPTLKNSEENILLNSFVLTSCKHCNSELFRKKGFSKNGLQRYKCKSCQKSFTILTNTIFENHKIPITEWIEFCLNIFGYMSISSASKSNKNSFTTTRYWLQKIFLLLENYQNAIVLSGNIQIDETYYSVITSDKILIEGKQLRGLSKNQYCIAIGVDETQIYARLIGLGKPFQKKIKEVYLKHIEPKSHLIHDMEKSHKILIKTLNLTEKVYNSKDLKKLVDKDNPLNKVNKQCNLLKKFLNSHSGFNRDDLNNYINLFCFIQNPPHERLEKVKILLDIAIHNTKKLKYRDFYSSNH